MAKVEPFWIEVPTPGRLALMPRPRGGIFLEDDLQALRKQGVDALVSLLTPEENARVHLETEGSVCQSKGIAFTSFPVRDHKVPDDRPRALELTKTISEDLRAGRHVVIHCWVGIGRSATLAACVLLHLGMKTEKAFQAIAKARWCPVPETEEQKAWVAECERHLRAGADGR